MKTHRQPHTQLFLLIGMLALVITTLLACGPADESVQREIGNLPSTAQETLGTPTPEPTAKLTDAFVQQDIGNLPTAQDGTETPTPEPTDDPTPESTPEPEYTGTVGTYPKLDDLLQDIVNKYETNELSESQAAALAPEHFRNHVLVQVNLKGRDDSAVEEWMGQQAIEPHYTVKKEVLTFHSYAFVPVSKLAPLSQIATVENIEALENWLPEGEEAYMPKPEPESASGQSSGESEPQAELPAWLHGYPHPRTYPGLSRVLSEITAEYDTNGTVSDELLKQLLADCQVEDQSIHVEVRVETAHLDAFLNWLVSQSLNRAEIGIIDAGFTTLLDFMLPFSLLETTGGRPEVYSVDVPTCFSPLSRYHDTSAYDAKGTSRTAGQVGNEEPCPHTAGSYPKLSDALQSIVRKYETCELLEELAAAEAPESFENKVLIQADLSTADSAAETAETWMAQQGMEPRYTVEVAVPNYPCAYIPFEGEQHGFRRAENIRRALDGELYFYSRVFGFDLADPVEPVEIENL